MNKISDNDGPALPENPENIESTEAGTPISTRNSANLPGGKPAGFWLPTWFISLSAGSLLLLGVYLGPDLLPQWMLDHESKGEGGIVIVDSPEVYSRERLINDRFRQVNWLENELKESTQLFFGNQAISDLRQIWKLDTTLSIETNDNPPKGKDKVKNVNGADGDSATGQKDSTDREHPSNRQDAQTENQNVNNRDLSVTPTERFRDMLAYREEIRTELMETLLDDRHDIKGNTLYRLKFDTTILPEEKTEKFAVIQVRFSKAGFCDDRNPGDPLVPCISVDALHSEWVKQTEKKLNGALDATVSLIRNMQLPPEDLADFVNYLQRGMSEITQKKCPPESSDTCVTEYEAQIKNDIETKFENITRWEHLNKLDLNCLTRFVQKNSSRQDSNDRVAECRAPVYRFFQSSMDPNNSKQYNRLRQVLLQYYKQVLAESSSYKILDTQHENYNLITLSASDNNVASDLDTCKASSGDPSSGDPSSDDRIARCIESFQKSLETEFAQRVGKLLESLSPQKSECSETGSSCEEIANHTSFLTQRNELDRVIRDYRNAVVMLEVDKNSTAQKEKLDIVEEAAAAELALLRLVVAEYLIDRYKYPNKEFIKKCDAFRDSKLSVVDNNSLGCLAHLDIVGCDTVENCKITASEQLPRELRNDICELSGSPDSEACFDNLNLRDRFKDLLNFNESYYSYAITPKESSQRVLNIASERRQRQLTLALMAKLSTGLDSGTVKSIVDSLAESSSQIEQIQRKPLILSFGRGLPIFNSKSQGANGIETHKVLGDNIDFGWIVGPKYLFLDKGNNDVRFSHAPVQNSLSAVLSVPTWWTAVNVDIETCWIGQEKIKEIAEELVLSRPSYIQRYCHHPSIKAANDNDISQEPYNNDISYVIRLPGSAIELPRKFGYEIERVPSIQIDESGQILADFYVGQENASLIIKGDELWRSTVVTMGNQKANKIEVLPNMKGIIATFTEVAVPDQKIEPVPPEVAKHRLPFVACAVHSKVVVWTSEGKTIQPLYVRIHANKELKGSGSSGGKHPLGFGECNKSKMPPKETVRNESNLSNPSGSGGDSSPK